MQIPCNAKNFHNFFNVSRETIKKLILYEELLKKQNDKYNLISKSSVANIWIRHFADSAKIFYILKEMQAFKKLKSVSLCDVGSGAGLPGALIEMLKLEEGLNCKTTLIESNAKKCNFLNDINKKLCLNAQIINARSEELNQKFDIIVARAVAPLTKLLEQTIKSSKNQTFFVFPKGKTWNLEVNLSKKKWNYQMNIVKNNKLIDKSGGVTLILTNCKKK